MSGIASLAQDWWYNVEVVCGFIDGRVARDILLSWPVVLAALVFPAARLLSASGQRGRWLPVVGGLQVFALLAMLSFPAIYAGASSGYHEMIVTVHVATVLTVVLLGLGAYYVMGRFRRDMWVERVLVGMCVVVLVGMLYFYKP